MIHRVQESSIRVPTGIEGTQDSLQEVTGGAGGIITRTDLHSIPFW
jgi:hypothetical protein